MLIITQSFQGENTMPKAEVVIIGSGIAALMAADEICDKKNVIVFTKGTINECNSMIAQGGVAAAVSQGDTWQQHYEDTLVAGCYVNNKNAVMELVKNGPKSIEIMLEKGMKFDCDENGMVQLGKEGAHGHRRILHAGGDATGKHLIETLLNRLKGRAKIIENEAAVDFLLKDGRCVGVAVIDERNKLKKYYAHSTILATGGIGSLYQFSSNVHTATGDGIAMAYRAGCELADLEFVQFHPTLLYLNGSCHGLISEAVRGEGAFLVTSSGKRVMQGLHPMEDLAPRDIVSRAIFNEMKNGEDVYLDISTVKNFSKRFPTIYENLIRNGLDLDHPLIPIVPGAHFHMGGVKTNENGETSIKQLFAIGEVACTGVHGANRLASNSLLEGMVFGERVAQYLLNLDNNEEEIEVVYELPSSRKLPAKEEIQEIMMKKVGIIRTEKELQDAINWFKFQLSNDKTTEDLTVDLLVRWNMLTVGSLIAQAALNRKESVGSHFLDIRESATNQVIA